MPRETIRVSVRPERQCDSLEFTVQRGRFFSLFLEWLHFLKGYAPRPCSTSSKICFGKYSINKTGNLNRRERKERYYTQVLNISIHAHPRHIFLSLDFDLGILNALLHRQFSSLQYRACPNLRPCVSWRTQVVV